MAAPLAALVATSRLVTEDLQPTRVRSATSPNFFRKVPADELPIGDRVVVGQYAGRTARSRRSSDPRSPPGAAGGDATLTLREADAAFGAVARVSGAGAARDGSSSCGSCSRARPPTSRTSWCGCSSASCARARSRACCIDAVAQAAGCRAAACGARRCWPATSARSRAPRCAERRSRRSARSRAAVPARAADARRLGGRRRARRSAELGDAALEYKLDGARIQVHKRGDEVRGLHAQPERRHRRGAGSGRGRARACRRAS